MRRSIPRKLGDYLTEFVKVNEIGHRLKEAEVVELWGELAGPALSRYMRNVTMSKGILYVEVSSAVVKSELMMSADQLRTKLNEMAGQKIVSRIVFR